MKDFFKDHLPESKNCKQTELEEAILIINDFINDFLWC